MFKLTKMFVIQDGKEYRHVVSSDCEILDYFIVTYEELVDGQYVEKARITMMSEEFALFKKAIEEIKL